MGCSGSKASEVAVHPPPRPPSVVHTDGSQKPWKKNQVVPEPIEKPKSEGENLPAQSGPARKATVPAPTTVHAFVSESGKRDLSSVPDQGPVDVLADLRSLCSEKVHADGLASLSERLHAALNKHLPAVLRSHSQLKHAQLLREVAERAAACCDSVLQPVLTHINRVISNREAGSSLSEATSWEQMEFADFLGLLESACNAVYDQGIMDVGRAVSGLMELLHTLQQHCETHQFPLIASSTKVPALDELLAMLGIVFFRKVVLETADSAGSKLEQYQQLQEQVGWTDAQLATCTCPQARATLMYLQQVSAAGELRANVTVRRSAAFWDSLECAQRDGLLPVPQQGAACHKYFPSFVDTYAQGAAAASAGAGAGRKPAVDAGEGHGPRKEFFSLAGQDMAGAAGAQADAGDEQRRRSGEGAGSSEGRPALWVYNRTAGAYWYNTHLQDSPALRAAYQHAGWLMGQCLLNRAPLGLPFPPVLFRMLLEGDSFKPTLDTLAEFDPDAATSVRNVASLPADQLSSMLDLEGLPPGWTAAQYTDHAVRQVLYDSVKWQAAAVAVGFFGALDRRLLRAWQLGPAALAALVDGSGEGQGQGSEGALADLSKVFRVTLDEELGGPSAVLVELLWEVLGAWPVEQRRRFVEFVTGTARLPLPGSELLKVQAPFVAMGAAEHKATLGMLPQAHTCDNLLELPNYWESLLHMRGVRGGPAAVARGNASVTAEQLAELREETRRILDERLSLAVMNFEGYGLDERASGEDEEDERGGGGGRRGSALYVEVEPEEPGTPAPLTFESLASVGHLSQESIISGLLHSNAPASNAHGTATPTGGHCAGGSPAGRSPAASRMRAQDHHHQQQQSYRASPVVQSNEMVPPQIPVVSRGPGPGPEGHGAGAGAEGVRRLAPQLSEQERHELVLARLNTGFSSNGGKKDRSRLPTVPGGGELDRRTTDSSATHDVFA